MRNGVKGLNERISHLVKRISSCASQNKVSFLVLCCGLLSGGGVSTAFAMSAPGGQEGQGSGGGLGLFAPMILVFLIFYFLLIRPQAKQQKRHQGMLKDLKRGDQVITGAGIYGRVMAIADATVNLEIAENVRIKLDKKQVTQVVTESVPAEKKEK